jgi:hypothetical protein
VTNAPLSDEHHVTGAGTGLVVRALSRATVPLLFGASA